MILYIWFFDEKSPFVYLVYLSFLFDETLTCFQRWWKASTLWLYYQNLKPFDRRTSFQPQIFCRIAISQIEKKNKTWFTKITKNYTLTIVRPLCIEDLLTVFICILRYDFDQSDNVFQEKCSLLNFLLLLLPKGSWMEDMIWLVNIIITKHDQLWGVIRSSMPLRKINRGLT